MNVVTKASPFGPSATFDHPAGSAMAISPRSIVMPSSSWPISGRMIAEPGTSAIWANPHVNSRS